MSNVFGKTPPVWIIDTASSTAVSTDLLRVDQIIWVAGTGSAQDDECKVTDAAGHVIYDQFATGADYDSYPAKFPAYMNVIGLAVPTLAHGKVYIYLK